MRLAALRRMHRALAAAKAAERTRLAEAKARAERATAEAADLRCRAMAAGLPASAFEMAVQADWQRRLIAAAHTADAAATAAAEDSAEIRSRLAETLGRELAIARLIAAARKERHRVVEQHEEDAHRMLAGHRAGRAQRSGEPGSSPDPWPGSGTESASSDAIA